MVLEIPLRQRNVMLLAAGFAPAYQERELSDPELNLFTTIATLGTPHDVTVHELRVECFFPADEATARWFQSR